MGTTDPIEKPIIFFDGVCNLCNASVQFIIKRDKQGKFLFSSLQSTEAQRSLPSELVEFNNYQSLVLKKGEDIKTKSSAALTISRHLSGLWPALYFFMIIPKFLRDFIYDIIASNRYKWFGRKDECMIPSPEFKTRFIN
ncbi:MAG: thiol-disulfide oxidoreductase DCC family protein [Ekhidna sp.]|nr:thiol-disulfide oxidoreductase DCC family protein [Ekhidna sp.]MBC6426384.1 thiol-disulfide oxidoreductase DCC family protein [Ekhidna sp.]